MHFPFSIFYLWLWYGQVLPWLARRGRLCTFGLWVEINPSLTWSARVVYCSKRKENWGSWFSSEGEEWQTCGTEQIWASYIKSEPPRNKAVKGKTDRLLSKSCYCYTPPVLFQYTARTINDWLCKYLMKIGFSGHWVTLSGKVEKKSWK